VDREFTQVYRRNVDTIYRLCLVYLKNTPDAEDAVQSVFLKFINASKVFHNRSHEKAWFIVTAKNQCKDALKNRWRTHKVNLDVLPEIPRWDDHGQGDEILAGLLALPEKYKTVLYLYYYEGYSVKELSVMLSRKPSTVQTQLAKGRALLKIDLGGDFFG
jgi:RNA polymerase sigma-70 factor (ECF subfamily)